MNRHSEREHTMNAQDSIRQAIGTLDSAIADPRQGLPEDVFLFISRITPMVNVDLLVKDEKNRVLLTWRQDRYHEPGWHVPGGIVRFKEKFEERIRKVALNELGAAVSHDVDPVEMNQLIIRDREERSHFISLLFRCTLVTGLDAAREHISGEPVNGFWRWHESCPDTLLAVQSMYRKYFHDAARYHE